MTKSSKCSVLLPAVCALTVSVSLLYYSRALVKSEEPMPSTILPTVHRGDNGPGNNTVFVFSGRWRFLKIQFPFLFANLRVNGGIIDRIMYVMIRYDHTTHDHLLNLASTVNKLLRHKVVLLNYMGYAPYHPPGTFASAYDDVIKDVLRNPSNTYFKIDDDVIYIHPGTFESMIRRNNSAPCTIQFGNIAGANWRCSYIHQSMGLFDSASMNPKRLRFDYDVHAKCGWKSVECAQLSLNTFLSLYRKHQLERYLFSNSIPLTDKLRFSINFFVLDKHALDRKALLELWPIHYDDEYWWSQLYVTLTQPHCVVGNALVVHFSYFKTVDALMNSTLINEFQQIAYEEHADIPHEVWAMLHLD